MGGHGGSGGGAGSSGHGGHGSGAAGCSGAGSSGAAPAKFRHGLLQLMIHTIDPLHDGKCGAVATFGTHVRRFYVWHGYYFAIFMIHFAFSID